MIFYIHIRDSTVAQVYHDLRWHTRPTIPFYLQYPFDTVNTQGYIFLDHLDDFTYATLRIEFILKCVYIPDVFFR